RGVELVADVRGRARLQEPRDLRRVIFTRGEQQRRRAIAVDHVRSERERQKQREHTQASTSLPVLSPTLSAPTLILSRNVSRTFASGVFSGAMTWRLPFTVFQPPTNEVGSG